LRPTASSAGDFVSGAADPGGSAVGTPAPGGSAPGTRAAGVSAPAGERAKSEATELLAAIGAVQRAARRAVRGAAYAEPLPPARSELLRLTARRPGISVAEAAQELRLAPNSVSTMVSKLTADGLLSRDRAAADGRSVRLTVTRRGAARIEQWRDIRVELAGRALGRLPASDWRAITAAVPALARLAERMEEV
jgi:DNA-binding MarR family transcriptional regulator